VKRGEVWWVDFGEPKGAAPGFRRPVVIVQDDLLTDSALATVVVAPITSNLRRGLAVGNVTLDPKSSGLKQPSVVLTCQLTTVDKAWLAERVGSLARRAQQAIDEGMRLALGLTA
jgi:mRNA interferase MazF